MANLCACVLLLLRLLRSFVNTAMPSHCVCVALYGQRTHHLLLIPHSKRCAAIRQKTHKKDVHKKRPPASVRHSRHARQWQTDRLLSCCLSAVEASSILVVDFTPRDPVVLTDGACTKRRNDRHKKKHSPAGGQGVVLVSSGSSILQQTPAKSPVDLQRQDLQPSLEVVRLLSILSLASSSHSPTRALVACRSSRTATSLLSFAFVSFFWFNISHHPLPCFLHVAARFCLPASLAPRAFFV